MCASSRFIRTLLLTFFLAVLSTSVFASYAGPVYGDISGRLWMEKDYTVGWESEPGKVYQVYYATYIPTTRPITWKTATGALIAEDTITKWKDEGYGARTDPSGENVLKRYYKVYERLDAYYVDQNDPNASDSNPGTETLPWETIQRAANEVGAGAVVVVKEGTYRERVTLHSGGSGLYEMITFVAFPGHEVNIKGSDVFTNWTNYSGSIYSNDDYVAVAHPSPGSPSTSYLDLVFVDDQDRLEQVFSIGEMQPGTFFADLATTPPYTDDTLYVWLSDGSNPDSHLMEAAVREYAFRPSTEDIDYNRIKGFKMRHFSWGPQWGAVMVHHDKDSGQSTGWVIEDNEISWTTGSGVTMRGWGHIIRGNKLNDCGNCGAQSNADDFENPAPQNLLVENNEFKRNNWKNYQVEWASGGWKGGWISYSTFRNNVFVDNNGPGLWIDWGNYQVDIYDNYFDNNVFYGLRLEIAQYVNVWNNIIMNTRPSPNFGHRGAIYNMGDHNQIAHNFFYNNGNAIHLWNAGFPTGLYYTYYGTEDNEIYNNIFYDNNGAYHFSNATPDSNTFDNNLYDGVGGFKTGVYIGNGFLNPDEWRYGYTGEQIHSGKAAYLFHDFGSNYFALYTNGSFGIPSAPYKAEGWFYVPSGSSINNMRVYDADKKLTVTAADTGLVTVNVSGSTTSVSRDVWHSFEMYRVDETTLEVRIDDVLLNTFSMSSGVYAQQFQFGDGSSGAGSWGKFYFDDIKIYNGPTVYFEENCEDAGGPNDLFGPAGLVDFAGGDYHLLPSSIAIDAGLYQSFAPVDLDGVTRPDPPEIGPYEYVE